MKSREKAKTLFERILDEELPGFLCYETTHSAVIISLEGHPLVIPKKPYRDIFELPDDVAADIMQVAVKVARALKEQIGCLGVNLVQSNGADAGQDVFHFHMHVKPRFLNDSVNLTWDVSAIPDDERSDLGDFLQERLAIISE